MYEKVSSLSNLQLWLQGRGQYSNVATGIDCQGENKEARQDKLIDVTQETVSLSGLHMSSKNKVVGHTATTSLNKTTVELVQDNAVPGIENDRADHGACRGIGQATLDAVKRASEKAYPSRRKFALLSILLSGAGGFMATLGADPESSVAFADTHNKPKLINSLQMENPVRDTQGKLMPSPDPTVAMDPSHKGYELLGTTDFNYNKPGAAFSHYWSPNLVNWYNKGFLFNPGHEPTETLHSPAGRFWSPELHYFNGRWVLYYSAEASNAVRSKQRVHGTAEQTGTMELFVSTTTNIKSGNWDTHVLHYPGQDNATAGNAQERGGGDIDPTEVENPETGQRYLFWTEQPHNEFVQQLSPDGSQLIGPVRFAFGATQPWECTLAGDNCTVEGASAFYRNGLFYIWFSADSTWDKNNNGYKVGEAVTANPMTQSYLLDNQPVLKGGNGFDAPGGESQPVVGPNGSTYVFVHFIKRPDLNDNSFARYLAIAQVNFNHHTSLFYPLTYLGSENRNPPANSYAASTIKPIDIPLVSISDGMIEKHIPSPAY